MNSKFLSLILRHKPELINLNLDSNGWADTKELISKMNIYGKKIEFTELKILVEINNKQRFTFNDDFSKIRANQGHSIKIELNLKPKIPPNILFHGTSIDLINKIKLEGLKKMQRNHVHLSQNKVTAQQVGGRHGIPIVLEIDSQKMIEMSFTFYLSKNNVWLTENVLPEFIQFPN